jgi:hypothetical protein
MLKFIVCCVVPHSRFYAYMPKRWNRAASMWFLVGSGKLLLALASKVILGSESCGTHDHTLLFHDSGSCATLFLMGEVNTT